MQPPPLAIPAKYRPPDPGPHCCRERLVRRLQTGLTRRVTLMVAGPGFGKTVALADFARRAPLPAAWVQADAGDGDLVRFLWYLVHAVEHVLPGALPGVRELLSSQSMPVRDPEAAVATLVGDLVRENVEGLVLCIDDWYLVPCGSGTVTLLQRLVQYLPDHVHIFLTGRTRGDLPVDRWLLQGWLENINLDELRFDAAEAGALLREVHGVTVADTTATEAVRQTEGWAAGLHLLGLAVRGNATLSALPAGAPAPDQASALEGYLDAEVMATLSPERREFLLATSILDDLPTALCDRLRGSSDSATELAALAADGLFTYRVDPTRGTYRYHRMFRAYLLEKLKEQRGAGAVAELHRDAARLLQADGDLFAAMRHFLAAPDATAAAELMEGIGESAFWGHSAETLATWLEALPQGLLEMRPRLSLLAADIAQWNGQLEVAASHLERAATLCRQQGDEPGLADAQVRLGHIYLLRGESAAARRLMEAAIAGLPSEAGAARARCLVRLAMTEWMEGALERCEPLLTEALELFRALGDRLGEAWALHNLAIDVHVARGELTQAVASFHRVRDLCAHTASRLHCICLLNLGSNLAVLGRHAEGRGYLVQAMAMADQLAFQAGRGYALAYLGRLAAETGRWSEAAAFLEEAREIEARVKDPQLRLEALAAEVFLLRRQGNFDQALEAARQHLVWAHGSRNPYYLTASWYNLVWIHIGRGAAADAERALAKALELLSTAAGLYTRFVVRIAEAVLALALPGSPAHSTVDRALAEALALVAQQGYEGLFLAEGEWGLRLLREAERRGVATEFAGEMAARLQQSMHLVNAGPGAQTLPEPGADGSARLRIRLLGSFQVEVDGMPLAESAWRGRKPQDLAKLLALRNEPPPGLEECLDCLWPHLDRDAAQRNFRVTLHWLRRALGDELVNYSDGHCTLNWTATWCDTGELRRVASAAADLWQAGQSDAATQLYQTCVELYRGDLLAGDPPADWHQPHRDQMREAYLTALTRLGVATARAGDLSVAIAHLRRVVTTDPLREPAYRLLIRLLIRSGQRGEAARVYRACEDGLRKELGVLPSAATRALYEELQAAGG